MPGVTWSSYNKPLALNKAGHSYEFDYGPNRARYRQRYTLGGSERITHYVGGNFEAVYDGANKEFRHLVRANGKVVMMRREKTGPSGSSIEHEYLHRDHLGSITAVSKESDGSVLGNISYDAWGKRRSATDWASAYQAPASLDNFERGYTGHEHLSGVDIIHMNGRVYSAELGKMMSPDPVTQAPSMGRNYNRYTYAFNNPLKYTDPSGFTAEEGPSVVCPRDGPPACPPRRPTNTAPSGSGGAVGTGGPTHYDPPAAPSDISEDLDFDDVIGADEGGSGADDIDSPNTQGDSDESGDACASYGCTTTIGGGGVSDSGNDYGESVTVTVDRLKPSSGVGNIFYNTGNGWAQGYYGIDSRYADTGWSPIHTYNDVMNAASLRNRNLKELAIGTGIIAGIVAIPFYATGALAIGTTLSVYSSLVTLTTSNNEYLSGVLAYEALANIAIKGRVQSITAFGSVVLGTL